MIVVDENVTMSRDEFLRYCKDFVKKSCRICDGWVLSNNCKEEENDDIYIKKECVKYLRLDEAKNQSDKCDDKDSVCCTSENDNLTITFWEYHIIFNPSYGVPVLYFNAWKRNGTFLTINELNRISESNKICIISQQEHPLLCRPFYYLHPCDTAGILQTFKALSLSETAKEKMANPLISWLSTIAPVVTLTVNSQYALKSD